MVDDGALFLRKHCGACLCECATGGELENRTPPGINTAEQFLSKRVSEAFDAPLEEVREVDPSRLVAARHYLMTSTFLAFLLGLFLK